ncbi:uncharacterized protein DS421_5g160320 [Arachis hypogaea]|nr:uncharacterized protein DS421_5g160320 [Arachis hypogaea]
MMINIQTTKQKIRKQSNNFSNNISFTSSTTGSFTIAKTFPHDIRTTAAIGTTCQSSISRCHC